MQVVAGCTGVVNHAFTQRSSGGQPHHPRSRQNQPSTKTPRPTGAAFRPVVSVMLRLGPWRAIRIGHRVQFASDQRAVWAARHRRRSASTRCWHSSHCVWSIADRLCACDGKLGRSRYAKGLNLRPFSRRWRRLCCGGPEHATAAHFKSTGAADFEPLASSLQVLAVTAGRSLGKHPTNCRVGRGRACWSGLSPVKDMAAACLFRLSPQHEVCAVRISCGQLGYGRCDHGRRTGPQELLSALDYGGVFSVHAIVAVRDASA
jgi:hypothetical protein